MANPDIYRHQVVSEMLNVSSVGNVRQQAGSIASQVNRPAQGALMHPPGVPACTKLTMRNCAETVVKHSTDHKLSSTGGLCSMPPWLPCRHVVDNRMCCRHMLCILYMSHTWHAFMASCSLTVTSILVSLLQVKEILLSRFCNGLF